MNWAWWSLVIFLTFVAGMLGLGWWMTRHDQDVPVVRLADPEPLPGELYRPFPDTGPLLLLSEAAAAVEANAREVDAMCKRAEQLGMMP